MTPTAVAPPTVGLILFRREVGIEDQQVSGGGSFVQDRIQRRNAIFQVACEYQLAATVLDAVSMAPLGMIQRKAGYLRPSNTEALPSNIDEAAASRQVAELHRKVRSLHLRRKSRLSFLGRLHRVDRDVR